MSDNTNHLSDLVGRLSEVGEKMKNISPGGAFSGLAGGFDLGDIMKYEEAGRLAVLIREIQEVQNNLPLFEKEVSSTLVGSTEVSEEYRGRLVKAHYRLLDELLEKLKV